MIDIVELKRNLPPNENVPALLVSLLDYQNKPPNFERVDDLDFQIYDCGEGLLHWFGHDQAAASQFAIFGHSTDGSMYGCWLYPGCTLEDAPIVLLHSDGDGKLLANTLRDFLALLATGELMVEEDEEVAGPSQTLSDYQHWLAKEMGIPVPANGKTILETASARHPNLNDWLRQWQQTQLAAP